MIAASVKNILEKLNDHGRRWLEGAVGQCVSRAQYEVTLSHFLDRGLEDGRGDLGPILGRFGVEVAPVREALRRELRELRSGNGGKPALSPLLLEALELAWAEASLNLGSDAIRTGALLLALRRHPRLLTPAMAGLLEPVIPDMLLKEFAALTAGSPENPAAPGEGTASAGGSTLDRFAQDLTAQARQGAMDPVLGRDIEVGQVIDILCRRRKNNPILVGEAGVGKTAVAEGLALRIAAGDVPDQLKGVSLRSLDLGLLSAGAGVRGEFENRLKCLIKECKSSSAPVILFIDEAHTLIGAGGEAGRNDAANLLKPELARGGLKVLAATTLSEFRKHFEKDPAMARRFQMVRVEEPDPDAAEGMLQGVREKYEAFHGVRIDAESVRAACRLSHKFIAGRQLPDKAVDLLDTAAAWVKMGLGTPPSSLVKIEAEAQAARARIRSLEADEKAAAPGAAGALASAREALAGAEARARDLRAHWGREAELAQAVLAAERALRSAPAGAAAEAGRRRDLEARRQELRAWQRDAPLVSTSVTPEVVARIVSEFTGIPAGDMLKDEAAALLDLDRALGARVLGQERSVAEITSSLRAAKLGLRDPDGPLGVYLFTGPSGVGKTEMARAIANLLFGGERALLTLNMSEYRDGASATQLKGASAGYVGYGEGGVLSEGVRQRPYSVVLLDEIEKAHKDVLNLFYQIFDKGALRDGEGRDISFRNSVILMTSNLGSDTIARTAAERGREAGLDALRDSIRDELTAHFSPALLARCRVIPFLPLDRETFRGVVGLKLGKLARRLRELHGIGLEIAPSAEDDLACRCARARDGARQIDALLDRRILPRVSELLLSALAGGRSPGKMVVEAGEDGPLVRWG